MSTSELCISCRRVDNAMPLPDEVEWSTEGIVDTVWWLSSATRMIS